VVHTAPDNKPRDRIAELIEPLRVRPGAKVRLPRGHDPGFTGDLVHKRDGVDLLQRGVAMLADYQARLAAEDRQGVLVVLQALDAAGKDGTIRHVMSGVNPQGVHVHSFKEPSAEQLRGALEHK
jgi:polyphosphate kinase 2 (PPK2 family)